LKALTDLIGVAMRNGTVRLLAATILVAALGCGGSGKKADDGPRITGGGAVDPNAKPQRPTVGGAVGESKQ
jgi:hypothetical protein